VRHKRGTQEYGGGKEGSHFVHGTISIAMF